MAHVYPSINSPIPTPDLENWNTDRSVDVPVMVRGQMYKSSADVWTYWDGQAYSEDAGLMRVSAIGVSVTTSPLSADSSAVSAKQADAANLMVSCKSNDASLMRVSALGVSIDSVTTSPLSADGSSVSAIQADAANLRISSFSTDGGTLRVSSVMADAVNLNVSAKSLAADTLRISAFSSGANTLMVSGRSDDAKYFRVSALGITLATAQALSATCKEGTAFIGNVSATVKTGSLISATCKEGTAFIGQVSAILKTGTASIGYLAAGTNAIGKVSVTTAPAEGTAFIGNVSAKNTDGAYFRTSSYLPADTTGSLTVFRSLSLSASQAIKATAGAVYGYYLWNTTTVPQYVKLTNTSGAINVGTDTPIATFMLPASAAANVWFGQGLKGFTAGIGVHATSAVADNATTAAAASAVGGTIFYA